MNPVLQIITVRTLQVTVAAIVLHWLLHWPLNGPHAIGFFLTPLLCLSFVFTFIAPLSWGLPIVTRLPAQNRVVALTFDDGPSPETTPLILNTLREYGVTAAFFVLGSAVQRHPEIVKRIIAEGHTVGIHAYRHDALVLANGATIRSEIEQTRQTIKNAVPDCTPRWFRPPYGFKTLLMPFLARRAGCQMVAWSRNTYDYRHPADPQCIAEKTLRRLGAGDILLLHDGPNNKGTVAALPLILEGLKTQNFHCVSL